MRRDPFEGHRLPREVILPAVRWRCRCPLSNQDVADLLAERGIIVDRATVFRWVQTFGPEIARRAYAHRGWRGLNWHADETYVRVGGHWRYLWRAVNQNGRFIDFRLTTRRDAKAAKASLKQAVQGARLHRPVSICPDKAPGYRKTIQDLNRQFDPHIGSILHIDRKWRDNRIESDHAAPKRLLGTRRSFRSLRSAKATLATIETTRTIKNGHISNKALGVRGEIHFVRGSVRSSRLTRRPWNCICAQPANATVPFRVRAV
ncbi:IS6 family transposase [Jannaschia sp. W003]|uniref:IS6 family transposase n=1 Tax=Jannaschia sp. W003 TaxID=2867012 RepID=UPI0021A7E3AA|nr:IS6 family transposase [Jannaschia sp. W003]UWQ23113.1 IS6 family transposase [Jannaschia sp. W003]